MLNDLQVCDLLQAQYDGESHQFDFSSGVDNFDCALKLLPDCSVLCFEGSHDFIDAEHDLEADVIYPEELNGAGVHAGFWDGVKASIDSLATHIPKDRLLLLAGHSLGAGRVNLACAYLSSIGYTNMQRVKFGSPRCNDSKLQAMIDKFPVRSYWNHGGLLNHDIIGDVPRRIMPFFPYDTDEARIEFFEDADPNDPWLAFRWHHLFLYRRGLVKLCGTSS